MQILFGNIIANALGNLLGRSIIGTIIVVLIVVLVLSVKWHRNQVKQGKMGVGAYDLVLGGLVIIVIGAVSSVVGVIQLRYVPNREVVTTSPSIRQLSATTTTVVPVRPRADIERISGELPALSQEMDKIAPLSTALNVFVHRQPQGIFRGLSVADARNEANAFQAQLRSAIIGLEAHLRNNSYDYAELRPLVFPGPNIGGTDPLSRAIILLDAYINAISTLKLDATVNDVMANDSLWDCRSTLRLISMDISNWVVETKNRISDKRQELEEALRNAK